MMKSLLLSLTLVLASIGFAESVGSIAGTVYDEQTGEQLVGVNVVLVGSARGATTDLNGKYVINNIQPADYSLRVSSLGYGTKVITDVHVRAGENLQLDLTLRTEDIIGEEVVVTAERVLSTDAAVLSQRRKAAGISDAISAEQVKRTPDATTGDALRRVTGLSIVDNKFVYVRGITDRYNGTMLNGVAVTSTDTDVDKKSFAFDMFPANLLENTVVSKTATPDLPGDFTGGLVQINTLDFPGQQLTRLSLSTSYNSITNLHGVYKSQGGSSDWTGFGNGSRSYPSGNPGPYELGRELPNNWKQQNQRAPLNGALSFSTGDALTLGEHQFGYVTALSYRNGYQRTESETDYFRTGSRILEASGVRDQYSVLWGGLLDLNFKLAGLHKLSLKNSYSQTAEDKLSQISGIDENEQTFRTQVTEWDQRSLYVTKLSGEHRIPSWGDLDVQWQAAYISSIAREPDRKTAVYSKNVNYPEDYPYSKGLADRSWSDLREFTRSSGIGFSLPLGSAKVKFGGLAEGKRRHYDIRFYVAELERGSTAFELTILPIDSIFMPQNFGPGKFVMSRLDNPRDKYSAEQTLYAGYLMLDLPFTLLDQNLRFVGGARLENSEQLVNTISPFATDEPYIARLKKIDILPSVNLTYQVNDISNLRLAYSHSVNRPEFRELASFYFYDYSIYEGTYGNPLLQRAFSHNYDVRIEVFPGIGELVAVSYFYKAISGAIEQQLIVSSNPERTWFNSPKGRNYGWEFEVRKSLDFLGGFFSNFSVTGNYTRISSAIEYPVYHGANEYAIREMQGQSPYMMNLSLLFHEPALGTSINILYNKFGRRLDAVADTREQDVFEEPRGVLDASVSQGITAGLELKFTVKDWGARFRKFVTREGNPYRSIFQGTTYSVQASLGL